MAVQSAVAKLWLEKTGCPIVEGYGLSETSPVATANRTDTDRFTGTIGLPVPNTEIVILDDEGNKLPVSQLAVSGARGLDATERERVQAWFKVRSKAETARVLFDD